VPRILGTASSSCGYTRSFSMQEISPVAHKRFLRFSMAEFVFYS